MSEEAGAIVRLGRFLRNDWRTFRRRFDRVRRWFRARYMFADPRTLGLTRWLIGALLCADCIRRGSYARDYYSNDGLLTNHWHLFSPDSEFNFSLFHAFSTPVEVYVAFALAFACFFLFMIGYRTRLFNVLSLIWITSMDNRLVMIENGGYVVVNLITFWLCWVPSGRRFSVDSLRRALRQDRAASLDELDEPFAPDWLTRAHHSLASMILLFNFGIIYVFNVVNKYGNTWRVGETVHYVLHLDRMVTGLAVPFRELVPLWAIRVTTWTVLVVEAMIVMTIFWPYHRRWARPVALVLIFGLHTSFGLMMRLGPFSWFMIGWSSVLLMAVHWEAIEAWYAKRQPTIEVSIDPSSGLAWSLARLFRRLDVTKRLRFVEGTEETLRAREGEGPWRTGGAAIWLGMRGMLLGRYLLPLLRVAGLGLFDAVVSFVGSRPARIGTWFGLEPPTGRKADPAPSPLAQRFAKWRRRLRELGLTYFLLAMTSQLVNENKSIPPPIKHKQPALVRASIVYFRLFQGWGMFAPNPIRVDGVVAIDAITADGRHIDPLRGSVTPDLDLSDERGCGLQQIPQDYMNRIRLDGNKRHRRALEHWLRTYHERTGNPDDEIVYFAVYWLQDVCPPPGGIEPDHHKKICLASWRKRGVQRVRDETLPRPCKVESAGK